MHNHTPLSCLGRGSVYPGVCVAFPVPPALARVHHYRRDCVASLVRSDSYNHYITLSNILYLHNLHVAGRVIARPGTWPPPPATPRSGGGGRCWCRGWRLSSPSSASGELRTLDRWRYSLCLYSYLMPELTKIDTNICTKQNISTFYISTCLKVI